MQGAKASFVLPEKKDVAWQAIHDVRANRAPYVRVLFARWRQAPTDFRPKRPDGTVFRSGPGSLSNRLQCGCLRPGIAKTFDGQGVTAAHTGFLKDVPKMDFDRALTNTEFLGNFLILESPLN